MEKVVRININIEARFETGFSCEFSLTDMLFTSYEDVFNYEYLTGNLKKALVKCGNKFEMLTITLASGNSHDTYPPVIDSYRFLYRSENIVYSKLRGNSYGNENIDGGWYVSSKKQIFEMIKALCETGNRTFINLIKEKQTA